jgi:hypothetical protein
MIARRGIRVEEEIKRGFGGITQVGKVIRDNLFFGRILNFITGFLVGFSVSVALGFTQVYAFVFGLIVGLGVVVSGSLVAYLTIQSLFTALLTAVIYVLIRATTLVIPPEVFQVVFLLLILISPFVILIGKIRLPLMKISLAKSIELFSAILFAALVQVLRGRMPADAPYALTQMYGNEDNAGIIDVLSHSIHFGVSSNVSALGEFTNSIYISAAGFTSWFGDPSNLDLISPLTHWNMILLLMAWAPIGAMVVLAFSGKRPKTLVSLVAVAFMASMFGLLLWPFTSIGHTAVISSGLFAAALMAITLNERFSQEHPFVFATLLTALGFVAGNIWFPLFPFTAAVIGVAFLLLLRSEYKKNNKPLVFGLIGFFSVVAYNLLPSVFNLVSQNESLLQLQGGTRVASDSLILVWLLLSSLAFWVVTKKFSSTKTQNSNLFLAAVAGLIASNVYLFLTGILNNAGAPGYGASKYLLTSIAFSIPIFWIAISLSRKITNPLRVIGSGLALVFAILVAQPDSRPVAVSFLADSQEINTEVPQTGVFAAIQEALDKEADHILCVADFGFPLEDGLTAWDAYFCTRWGQAVAVNTLDAPTSQWSFAFLNRNDLSSNEWVRDTYSEENVVVIRFPDPLKPTLEESDTWWYQYVSPSWQIIKVK